MGFLDGLGKFAEGCLNSMDKTMERNARRGNVSDDDLADYYSSRANIKCCERCGGANTSRNSAYCYKCKEKYGLD